MRLGVNINGIDLPIDPVKSFIEKLQPDWTLVSGNLALTKDIQSVLSGIDNVIYRDPELERVDYVWKLTTSARDYVDLLIAHQDKSLVLYVLDSPVAHKADIRRFSNWMIEVITQLTDLGYKAVVGNMIMSQWETWEIEQGGLDPLLSLIAERRDKVSLGIKEYTGIVLPYGAGLWNKWDMLDRSKMQREWWPTYRHVNESYRVPNPDKIHVTPGQHFMRSKFLQYRVTDVLGYDPIPMILTDFGWNRPSDMISGQNHVFDALAKRYGVADGYPTLDSVNTLANIWNYYWPQWSTSQAAVEQLVWANEYYTADYEAILPLMFTANPKEINQGLNYGADPAFKEMLITYANTDAIVPTSKNETQVLNVKVTEETEGQTLMMPDEHRENLLRNGKLDGDIEVAEFEGTLSIHAPDDWEVYLDHKLQQFPDITMNEPGMTLSIDGSWRIDLVQDDILLESGKYYEAEVFSRLDYDDEDVDIEYSFHLIGDHHEIITPWQTPSGSTHVVISIPDNTDSLYQFRLCIRLNDSAVRGSLKLEDVTLVEVDGNDGFEYLDDAWVEEEATSNHSLDDPDWKSVWVSSTSHNGTHVRYNPSSDSASIGIVHHDEAALLIPSPIKRGTHYWYPIRINSNPQASHADGDFSNSGWIRSDVFTYKTVVVPQVEDSDENVMLFTLAINYNKMREDHLSLIDIIKRAASLFDKDVDMYDVPIDED